MTQLANMPHQDVLVKRWSQGDWRKFVDALWNTKNRLPEKELEYRNATLAIWQVGLGIGGMLLGLVGLALSIVVPMIG